jgi:AcrR family transcriptional regulator
MNDRRRATDRSPDDAQDSGRERVSRAAYELFSRDGVRAVGVDAVIARAGTAKMTLYRNFPSKDDLILEFLRRREQIWTHEWLEAESLRRAETPHGQLLAIFDVFAEWFSEPDFEGCSFLTTMIEFPDRQHAVYQASVAHLANIRSYIESLASAIGIRDTDSFARKWHILMKGSIMAAHEGDAAAAGRAREIGELLLREYAGAGQIRAEETESGPGRGVRALAPGTPARSRPARCSGVARALLGRAG